MAKKAVIDTSDRDYKKIKYRTPEGELRVSSGNGDAVHKAMVVLLAKGGTIKDVIAANSLDVKKTGANEGQLRMAIGGALRGLVRNGTAVKIGSIKVEKLTQRVDLPIVESAAPRKAAKKAKAKKSAKPRKARAAKAPAEAQEAAAA